MSALGSRAGRVDPVAAGTVAVPLVMLLAWALASRWVGADVLPGPATTVAHVLDGLADGWLASQLTATLLAVLAAFLLSTVLGLLVGVVLALRDSLREVVAPFLLTAYAVPKIVFFPVFLFVTGLGFDTKVAFGALHGVFPVAVITMGAFSNVDETYRLLARSLRLSRWQRFRHVLLPFALAELVVALRFAYSLAFVGVVLAELFASRSGIGFVLQRGMATFEMDRIAAAIFVLVLVAFAGNAVFYVAQRWLERYWGMTADTDTLRS